MFLLEENYFREVSSYSIFCRCYYLDISGKMGEVGVPDMVTISDIDEFVINKNLKKRYSAKNIYVSNI